MTFQGSLVLIVQKNFFPEKTCKRFLLKKSLEKEQLKPTAPLYLAAEWG